MQVMIGVSLRARWDATLVHIIAEVRKSNAGVDNVTAEVTQHGAETLVDILMQHNLANGRMTNALDSVTNDHTTNKCNIQLNQNPPHRQLDLKKNGRSAIDQIYNMRTLCEKHKKNLYNVFIIL